MEEVIVWHGRNLFINLFTKQVENKTKQAQLWEKVRENTAKNLNSDNVESNFKPNWEYNSKCIVKNTYFKARSEI